MRSSTTVKLVQLPKILDDCTLIFAQTPDHIPFTIKRIYYISRAHPKLPRGFHAHKKTKQIIFCLKGSIKLTLDNGKSRKEVMLNKPNIGVFLDSMIWHEMMNFKKNTLLLILASRKFDPSDYIRNYVEFKKRAQKNHISHESKIS